MEFSWIRDEIFAKSQISLPGIRDRYFVMRAG